MSEKIGSILTSASQGNSSAESLQARTNVGLGSLGTSALGSSTKPLYWTGSGMIAGSEMLPIANYESSTPGPDMLTADRLCRVSAVTTAGYPEAGYFNVLYLSGNTGASQLMVGNNIWYRFKDKMETSPAWSSWQRCVTATVYGSGGNDAYTSSIVSSWDSIITAASGNTFGIDGVETAKIGSDSYVGQLAFKAIGTDGSASANIILSPRTDIKTDTDYTVYLPFASTTDSTHTLYLITNDTANSKISEARQKVIDAVGTLSGHGLTANTAATLVWPSDAGGKNAKTYWVTTANGSTVGATVALQYSDEGLYYMDVWLQPPDQDWSSYTYSDSVQHFDGSGESGATLTCDRAGTTAVSENTGKGVQLGTLYSTSELPASLARTYLYDCVAKINYSDGSSLCVKIKITILVQIITVTGYNVKGISVRSMSVDSCPALT